FEVARGRALRRKEDCNSGRAATKHSQPCAPAHPHRRVLAAQRREVNKQYAQRDGDDQRLRCEEGEKLGVVHGFATLRTFFINGEANGGAITSSSRRGNSPISSVVAMSNAAPILSGTLIGSNSSPFSIMPATGWPLLPAEGNETCAACSGVNPAFTLVSNTS